MQINKKLSISIVIILVFLLGSYFLVHKKSTKENNLPKGVSTPITYSVDRSLVLEKRYTEPTKYTVFNVFYPQFKNASAKFNQAIENDVMMAIEQQKKDSEDNWKARYDTKLPGEKIAEFPSEGDKFNLDISWDSNQINQTFISLLVTTTGYSGGAHGHTILTSYNYDVTKGAEIKLADLFPGDQNYLKKISDYTRKDLISQLHYRLEVKTAEDENNFNESIKPMLFSGTEPNEENFNVFTFNSEEIVFYFNEYQVGPYSLGQSIVAMPR